MAFSGGFHPHPKISYANAAPTGTASEAEYFEISVTERADADAVRAALDAALPDGRETSVSELEEAVTAYLACERAEVSRVFKTGPKTFDTRSAVVLMSVDVAEAESGPPCAILRMVVRHTTPSVRPDDILTALRAVTALAPPVPPLVTRLAQGPLHDATAGVADPLAADKAAAGS